jgi:hypothetical protein
MRDAMPDHVVSIVGLPRSGTSWLGAIFDSSPNVAYRYQPLFSYAFKNALDANSDASDFKRFFNAVYASDDDFLNQAGRRKSGAYPPFQKHRNPAWLVFKNVRYHNLLEPMLNRVPGVTVIAIVRHPCACINSWLRAPREFPAEADPRTEWRDGKVKKAGRAEEFWGFDDWKKVTRLHLDIEEREPRAHIVRYEDLVDDALREVTRIFRLCGLEVGEQTRDFLAGCHDVHHDDPYSVFKSPKVANQWKRQLDPEIRELILRETREDERLRRFITP